MTWTAAPTRAPARLFTLLAGLLLTPAALAGPADEAPPRRAPETSGSPALNSSAGAVTRALALVGADRWHAAGYRGQGLTVAVLDSGFRGWRDHLGAALPPAGRVTARSFRLDGNLEARNSQHGILCGEVVHALAPDANLLLANWEPDRPDTFLAAVRWAREQGAKVISCSVIMPSWSDCEGGGRAHRELAKLLGDGRGAGDVLFIACAGNTAQRHWRGDYRPGRDGWHVWESSFTANPLTPWGTEQQVSVELSCPTGCGYEIVVEDENTGATVVRDLSLSHADMGAANAVARFSPQGGHSY